MFLFGCCPCSDSDGCGLFYFVRQAGGSYPPQPESAALGFQSVVTAGLETRAAGDPTPLNASFKINLDTNDAYSTAVNNQEVKYTDGSGYSISPAIYLLKSSRNMVAWAPVGVEPDAEAAPNVFTLNPGNTTAAVDFVYQENTEVNPVSARIWH